MESPGSHSQAPVIIVGAGMAGLSAAKTLQDAGGDTLLFEASDHVGGRDAISLGPCGDRMAISTQADRGVGRVPFADDEAVELVPVEQGSEERF